MRSTSLIAEHLFSGATEAAHGPGRTQGTGATECQFEVTNAKPPGENAMGAPNNRPLLSQLRWPWEICGGRAGFRSGWEKRPPAQETARTMAGNRTGKAWKSCSVLWGLAVVGKSEGGHRGLSTSGVLGALSVKPFDKRYLYLTESSQQPSEVGTYFPMLQVSKLRLREVTSFLKVKQPVRRSRPYLEVGLTHGQALVYMCKWQKGRLGNRILSLLQCP